MIKKQKTKNKKRKKKKFQFYTSAIIVLSQDTMIQKILKFNSIINIKI
jgi:hypothetical protein